MRDRASCCLSFGTDVGGSARGGVDVNRRVFVFEILEDGVLEDGATRPPGARGFGNREGAPPLGRAEAVASAADMPVEQPDRPCGRGVTKPREEPAFLPPDEPGDEFRRRRETAESPRPFRLGLRSFRSQNPSRSPVLRARTYDVERVRARAPGAHRGEQEKDVRDGHQHARDETRRGRRARPQPPGARFPNNAHCPVFAPFSETRERRQAARLPRRARASPERPSSDASRRRSRPGRATFPSPLRDERREPNRNPSAMRARPAARFPARSPMRDDETKSRP